MKRIRQEHVLFFWFASSVCLSAVLCNRLFYEGIISYQALYLHLNQGWTFVLESGSALAWKIIVVRLAGGLALILCLRSRFKRFFLWVLPVLAGVCVSALITVLTWSRGISGFLFFGAVILPHGIFYSAALVLLVLGYGAGYEIRKSRFWSVVLCLESFGIVTEIIINPWILQFLV